MVSRVLNWGSRVCVGVLVDCSGSLGSMRVRENNWAKGSMWVSFWRWCKEIGGVGVVPCSSMQAFL